MHKDIFVIGGGINGTGIAADAAGRGLSVALCEKGDLASGTSSASTKLIHGGLRYLEHYEFNLVRKALLEREILMRKAPHLITPLEFILPYEKHLRPAWLIRLGLFLYDHLARHKRIPYSKSVSFKNTVYGTALKDEFKKGFSYYDCFTDDARLVIENALAAKEHGADVLTHTEFVSAQRENKQWKILLRNVDTGEEFNVYASALINAAGPGLHESNRRIHNNNTTFSIQLVKGSHIVIPKLYAGNFAYILQNNDKRIVFTIPYQENFTLIGTTDVLMENNQHVEISAEEKEYLCHIVNHYFKKSISQSDIVWSYAGIRCLQNQAVDHPSETTRDYKIILTSENHAAPLLTIIGGKMTTFRDLALDALKQLETFFPHMGKAWTATTPLPGGNFLNGDFEHFYKNFQQEFSWLPEEVRYRYARSYGTRAYLFLNNTHCLADLGEDFGAGLYQKEVEYLVQHEWAKSVEDILWRRSKLGLFFPVHNLEKLKIFISLNATHPCHASVLLADLHPAPRLDAS